MARTVAPLLSFGASGAIAKTQVYSKWKGRPYARRYVIPANPDTTDQQAVRNVFKWLNDQWKYLPGDGVAGWDAYATVNQFTARNGWLKQNVGSLIGETDLTNLIFSPSARSGLIADAIAVTGGDGSLSVTLTAPSLPTGWTITKAVAEAIEQQSPASGTLFGAVANSVTSSPYTISLTGLTNGQEYQVGGWFEFSTAAGLTAYGQSKSTTGTPSA